MNIQQMRKLTQCINYSWWLNQPSWRLSYIYIVKLYDSLPRYRCRKYHTCLKPPPRLIGKQTNDNLENQPFEDVCPNKHGDFPVSCLFSGGVPLFEVPCLDLPLRNHQLANFRYTLQLLSLKLTWPRKNTLSKFNMSILQRTCRHMQIQNNPKYVEYPEMDKTTWHADPN